MTKEETEIKIADYFCEPYISQDFWELPFSINGSVRRINRDEPELLAFTESLDWIEPVLEKIESEGCQTSINYYCDNKEYSCFIELGHIEFAYLTKSKHKKRIDAIVEAVLVYIDYKNKQS